MYLHRAITPNLGDTMNVNLVEYITGKVPKTYRSRGPNSSVDTYLVIGSILQWARSNTIVWGSGFLRATDALKVAPKKICAVRGKLSREKLLSQNIDCPEVYGDPSLLYPRYYKPKVQKKYSLGIVPHYVDKPFVKKYDSVLIIDVQAPVNEVVNQICSCEHIASSSLHGLVVADAYKIPSTWIEYSDKVIGKGFKFKDYFSSVGRKEEVPLQMNSTTTIKDIMDRFYKYDIEIDLDKLFDACPFRKR